MNLADKGVSPWAVLVIPCGVSSYFLACNANCPMTVTLTLKCNYYRRCALYTSTIIVQCLGKAPDVAHAYSNADASQGQLEVTGPHLPIGKFDLLYLRGKVRLQWDGTPSVNIFFFVILFNIAPMLVFFRVSDSCLACFETHHFLLTNLFLNSDSHVRAGSVVGRLHSGRIKKTREH